MRDCIDSFGAYGCRVCLDLKWAIETGGSVVGSSKHIVSEVPEDLREQIVYVRYYRPSDKLNRNDIVCEAAYKPFRAGRPAVYVDQFAETDVLERLGEALEFDWEKIRDAIPAAEEDLLEDTRAPIPMTALVCRDKKTIDMTRVGVDYDSLVEYCKPFDIAVRPSIRDHLIELSHGTYVSYNALASKHFDLPSSDDYTYQIGNIYALKHDVDVFLRHVWSRNVYAEVVGTDIVPKSCSGYGCRRYAQDMGGQVCATSQFKHDGVFGIYSIFLCTADQLRRDDQRDIIMAKMPDDATPDEVFIVKLGRTNDCKRRLGEHSIHYRDATATAIVPIAMHFIKCEVGMDDRLQYLETYCHNLFANESNIYRFVTDDGLSLGGDTIDNEIVVIHSTDGVDRYKKLLSDVRLLFSKPSNAIVIQNEMARDMATQLADLHKQCSEKLIAKDVQLDTQLAAMNAHLAAKDVIITNQLATICDKLDTMTGGAKK